MTGRAETDLARRAAFNLRLAVLAVLSLCAHRGVALGQDLVRRDIPGPPPRSAVEQAKLFHLRPGFRKNRERERERERVRVRRKNAADGTGLSILTARGGRFMRQ